MWQPSDNCLALATHDPALSGVACEISGGHVYLQRLKNDSPQPVTVHALWFAQSGGPGTGPSTGSYCGLYGPDGTLLSGSADIGTAFTDDGQYPVGPLPLTTPQVVAPWSYAWGALLLNLAALPNLVGCTDDGSLVSTGIVGSHGNQCGPASSLRWALIASGWWTPLTGLTALPASFTPANLSFKSVGIWCGAS